MDKLIDVVTTAGAGALFTSAGFGLKILVDYNFLKSPQIIAEVTISGNSTMSPRNGYRKYTYNIAIEFYNHSKNEAYGFELVNFKLIKLLD